MFRGRRWGGLVNGSIIKCKFNPGFAGAEIHILIQTWGAVGEGRGEKEGREKNKQALFPQLHSGL